jgi:hypothetical protein
LTLFTSRSINPDAGTCRMFGYNRAGTLALRALAL